MIVNLTFDVEEFDFPVERGVDIDFESQLSVSTEGLEKLLLLLENHQVKATFYVTANYALHRTEIIKRVADDGHEIASHDYYHSIDAKLNPAGSKKLLQEIIGKKIIGYRAPRLKKVATKELLSAGYQYNSSMNPTWLPFRYNNLLKPRTVFKDGDLLQYPTSVSWPFRIPLFWLSFHVMNQKLYQSLALSALKKDGHLNLYFHPWEFSDRLLDNRFAIPSYIKNCSGQRLLKKLDQLISFLKQKDCVFITTKKYLGFDE